MNMVKSFFAVLVPLLILDAVWLVTMNKFFYMKHIGFLLSPKPVWSAIIIFYALYAAGVAFLVVIPAVTGSVEWTTVLLRGAIFGLIAYATYDLTNQATITNWPIIVTVVDMVWGTVLTAVASTGAFLILK
jgi:uncharacterized membrane protein